MLGKDIEFKMERLTADNSHFIGGFNCGTDSIDLSEYLVEHALMDNECVTYIFVTNVQKVIAYVSLSCTAIVVKSAGNGEITKYIPAVLIDKFAVDDMYHGMQYDVTSDLTLSEVIFYSVVDEIYNIMKNVIGAKYIVLYATDRALHFYEKCNLVRFDEFMDVPKDPRTLDCTAMFLGPF